MFDLNEVPDQPAVEARVEDCDKAVSLSASNGLVRNDITEETMISCEYVPLSSSSIKADEVTPIVEEVVSVKEILASKRPAPTSVSLELTSAKRQNANVCDTVEAWQHKDLDSSDAVVNIARAVEDLGSKELLHHQQNNSNRKDLFNDIGEVAFHFLGKSSGDHLPSGIPVNKQEKVLTGTILSLNNSLENVAASEGSTLGLSLGGIFHTSFAYTELTNQTHSTPIGKDLSSTGLCKAEQVPLTSRKSSDLSPFWRGKLRANNTSVFAPIVAYCLGIMTPNSRLKKLPSTLTTKRFLKLEELEKTLNKGVAEPLMQLKPSTEASSEESKFFYSMVKTLSHGLEPVQFPTFSRSVADQQDLPADGKSVSSAALVSWDGDISDAKLCLISVSSIKALLKVCKSSSLLDALEDVGGLDPESLYGIISYSTSGVSSGKLDLLLTDNMQNTGRAGSNKQPERIIESSVASAERGRDTAKRNRTASPSNKMHLITPSDILCKSASMQLIRNSGRDADHKLNFEEVGKGPRKCYEKQLSSSDKIREASGKCNSRYGSGTRDLDEDDTGNVSREQGQLKQREKLNWNSVRQTSRQESRSDRLKDSRRSKDDRDSSKHRVKEHHRHAYRDEERDNVWKSHGSKEQHRDQEKLHWKDREKSVKENVMEDSKLKSATEKNSSGSKSKVSLSLRISPDLDSGRLSRKRDREDEKKEHVNSAKHPRESGLNDSKQLLKDLRRDLKPKPSIEHIYDHLLQKESGSAKGLDSAKPGKDFHILDTQVSDHGKFDGRAGAMEMDTHVLDANLAMPPPGHGSVDEGLKVSKELWAPDSHLGACEIGTSPNSSRLFVGRSGLAEDGTLSAIMNDSFLEKVIEEKDLSAEFTLDVHDKETRTWLLSKQNAIYLEEEYGVHATICADVLNGDADCKTDVQTGPVTVRISVVPSEPCDAAEDKWFLEQASITVKSIASRGVFIKCLWYEGPVQLHPGDGAPSVPIIAKKIKGEDGKNLDRIQDLTGVMIGVVLRKRGTGSSQEMELVSRPRNIGLRLTCVRRKGLLEASREAEALLECVADHFSKELATHIATHIVDLQAPALHPAETISNQGSPLVSSMAIKELLPNLPAKDEGSPGSCKMNETAFPAAVLALDSKPLSPKEEPDVSLSTEQEVASRSLYVSDLPDHITAFRIQNIFENVLREKLERWPDFDHMPELVVHVRCIPEKFCAFVLLANDALLNASLKLYAEDKTVFQGMKVELGPSERQGSVTRIGVRSKDPINREHARATLVTREEANKSRRQGAANNDNDSDCSLDQCFFENVASRTDPSPGRPRPLFLSELMRNASAPLIKQLFEDIIATYISPNLVSDGGGRQLVLDVRYVPSRGCAFVDLATPELVEFMLDLHSRRPEVFMNMKMELGRKPVPFSVEEDGGGRLNLRLHGKSHLSSQTFGYRLSLASRRKGEKRTNGSIDLEDSDKGDDLWLNARTKKQRSDPEKTIYVDRLPENASEGTIKKIFERVLMQKLAREEVDALGDQVITEVRHIPTKYCAFVVFATEDLTRTVLHLYNKDEEIFGSMRLKPHFHSRMEDLYKDEDQEFDEVVHTSLTLKDRIASLDSDNGRLRQSDLHDSRTRSAAHRAITASAFREVDRRRSVYVDKIPDDLSESTMTEMFEKVFRRKKHSHNWQMVSQVAYFRDKFDFSKLCAFVELKTEDGTQDLVDYYNANQDAFRGMRVRPGMKYHS